MDTEWSRYEVFEQERAGQPHRSIGTVHAPDAEIALQNARDVFARRPECASLWVAPANQIHAWTAESLQADPDWQSETLMMMLAPAPYEVFQKLGQRQAETYVTHVGQVQARTPTEALRQAVSQFGSGAVFVWWVVPARAILRSEPAEAESWFGPARDKRYRQPGEYRVLSQMREDKPGAAEGSTP